MTFPSRNHRLSAEVTHAEMPLGTDCSACNKVLALSVHSGHSARVLRITNRWAAQLRYGLASLLVVVLTGCSSSVSGAETSATVSTITTVATTGVADTSLPDAAPIASSVVTAAVLNDGCHSALPSTSLPYADLPTFMTLVPGTIDLTFTLEAQPTAVCPGAVVRFSIGVHNDSESPLEVSPRLVITEVLPHIVLGTYGPVAMPSGGNATIEADVTIPLLPPGIYRVFVANGAGYEGVSITVRSPTNS